MTQRRSRIIPEPITQLQQQLAQFRSANPPRAKLPESLWQSAVVLARQYSIWQTVKPLRLDYMGLKKRLTGSDGRKRKAAAFVELVAAAAGEVRRIRDRVRVGAGRQDARPLEGCCGTRLGQSAARLA